MDQKFKKLKSTKIFFTKFKLPYRTKGTKYFESDDFFYYTRFGRSDISRSPFDHHVFQTVQTEKNCWGGYSTSTRLQCADVHEIPRDYARGKRRGTWRSAEGLWCRREGRIRTMRRSKFVENLFSRATLRGLSAILIFILIFTFSFQSF